MLGSKFLTHSVETSTKNVSFFQVEKYNPFRKYLNLLARVEITTKVLNFQLR